ncbi:MAG: methionine--tRNA ligase [Phycisphaerales bacterium]
MTTSPAPLPPYYITTPIYYVNDRPHIGHCYTTLLADVATRFQRLIRGELDLNQAAGTPHSALGDKHPRQSSIFFLTGTDEHAEKVVTTAASHNLTPIQWADQNSDAFQEAFRGMGIDYDDFIRTTQARHKDAVARYLRQLLATGDVAEGEYEGWYDVNDEAYVTETKAKEQNFLASNGKPLVRRKEKNFYFKLSTYQSWLESAISSGEIRIEPEARKNEVLGRLREGLQDVPITRPVTDDPATQFGIRLPGHEEHRVYVWIDALFNYLSAVDTPERQHFWPPTVHLMGKEILWFHAVIWPAILKALNRPMPRLIYAHSHYTRDGMKMSKSLGNFIDLDTIKAYTNRFGVDALRWYLLTQGPLHATDADFSHGKFVEVYNADLANGFGNCVSRVSNMIGKYFGGKTPPPNAGAGDLSASGERLCTWSRHMQGALDHVLGSLPNFDLYAAAAAAIGIIRRVDLFIADTRPFSIAKTMDADATGGARRDLESILHVCAEALRIASLLLYPAMPTKIAEFWRRWNCDPRAHPGVPLEQLAQFAHPTFGLKPGTNLEIGDPLFMRIDPAEPAPA